MKLARKKIHRTQLIAAFSTLAIGISLALSGCGGRKQVAAEDDTEDSGENETPAAVISEGKSLETAAVSGTTESKHFAAVAKHLDLGGTVFGYLDIDGDVEKIADLFQGFLDMAKEESGGNMPPHLATLDIGKMLGKLGVDGVEAIGVSSYKDGEMYHNKGYVHVPAGREGLLKILGGEPQPFVATKLAPGDSDLVIEQSLDVRAGFEVVNTMVADLGGPEATAQFQQAVGEVIPQLGLSMADLFRKLDTHLTVIGRIHPDKPLQIPDGPEGIPSFDLLVVLDNVGWLYEKVTTEMKKEMPADQQAQMFVQGDGFERIALPPMPDPEMVIAQPVIHHDVANKRVLIASSPAFLDECVGGGSNLSENADFVKAMTGLPTEGNGMSFVSKKFMDEYSDLVGKMMGADGGGMRLGAAEVAMMTSMMDGLMPKATGSQASVTVNTPEGILMAANSSQSYKDSFAAGFLGGFVGGAAITMPALNKAQSRAKEAQQEAMRRQEELMEEMRRLDEGNDPGADAAPEIE